MIRDVLAGLVMTTLATGALAHSKAEDTTPAKEATGSTVQTIEMRFDDPMRLTGLDGDLEIERETGMDAVTEFRALPPAGLPDGHYTVDRRGLAADGHPMQVAFTVAD